MQAGDYVKAKPIGTNFEIGMTLIGRIVGIMPSGHYRVAFPRLNGESSLCTLADDAVEFFYRPGMDAQTVVANEQEV